MSMRADAAVCPECGTVDLASRMVRLPALPRYACPSCAANPPPAGGAP